MTPERRKEIFEACEASLKARGGRRLNVRLEPQAVQALAYIQAELGVNQTYAIHQALFLGALALKASAVDSLASGYKPVPAAPAR